MAVETLIRRDSLYIGGEWVAPAGDETIDVVEPATEELLGRVPAGAPADVDAAVAAARAAFDGWSQVSVYERAALCADVARRLGERGEELVVLLAREVGSPLAFAQSVQLGLPVIDFNAIPQLVEEVAWEEEIGNSLVVREPVGVVGTITPWNYPLHQLAAKVAPALAAGCCVVAKPSEVTPLSAYVLAEVLHDAGLPAGVFNLVPGYGPVAGEAIAAHPGVDMVSFTGSTRAGRRVAEVAAATVKRVSLELGGKSANVILDDADLVRAISDGIGKCFLNSGQTCSALTRMLVPRERLGEAEAIAAAVVGQVAVGDPFAEGTQLGPLVSHAQRERVRGYIRNGIEEGAMLACGGPEAPQGMDKGFFVKPTVFAGVKPSMTIAREEIFGPVLSILPYRDEEEAVEIANGTVYGLAGAVWSADRGRAENVARRMRTGQVDINGGLFNLEAPFGGYRQSGIGRENGRFGMEEFLELKAMQFPK